MKKITAFGYSAMFLSMFSLGANAQELVSPLPADAQSRVIIAMEDANKGLITALTRQLGGEINVDGSGFVAATFRGKSHAQIRGLLNHPAIKLVEPDQLRSAFGFADDSTNPHTAQTLSYAFKQVHADKVRPNAGSLKKVCVIDSGLDGSHPDFDFGQIQGTDDAGTGRWDVAGGAHGTHVAGIIAAADNSTGTLGVAGGTALHIVKVFDANGWAYSSSLAYAAQQCMAAGAHIINMSLGGGTPSSTEESVFASFAEQGGLSIAAAGNAGTSARSYPAGYPSVMMIGANDANDVIASFSQFPSCTTGTGRKTQNDEGICVEVSAGGVRVLSSIPVESGSYAYMSGTSMATPVVSGVASAVWSHFPHCSGQQIRQAIKQSAADAGAAGKDPYFGYGIVKADAAYNHLLANQCTTTALPEEPAPCRGKSCK